jgi:hypothetical protein
MRRRRTGGKDGMMNAAHGKVVVLLFAAFAIGCGTNGGTGAGDQSSAPEKTVRALFAAEWNANADSSWAMFHPILKASGVYGDFVRYANDLLKKKEAWQDHPRSITRIKTFSGNEIPKRTRPYTDRLDRAQYEFAVVRVDVFYPPVKEYIGGTNDYLITLVRKKEKGADWQIIDRLKDPELSGLYAW